MPARENEATVRRSAGDLLITLCGLATSLATAGILKFVEALTGLSLYTLSLW